MFYDSARPHLKTKADLRRESIGRSIIFPGQTPQGFYEPPPLMDIDISKNKAAELIDYAAENALILCGQPVTQSKYMTWLEHSSQHPGESHDRQAQHPEGPGQSPVHSARPDDRPSPHSRRKAHPTYVLDRPGRRVPVPAQALRKRRSGPAYLKDPGRARHGSHSDERRPGALDEIHSRGHLSVRIERTGKHSYALSMGGAEFEFEDPGERGPGIFLTSSSTDR